MATDLEGWRARDAWVNGVWFEWLTMNGGNRRFGDLGVRRERGGRLRFGNDGCRWIPAPRQARGRHRAGMTGAKGVREEK